MSQPDSSLPRERVAGVLSALWWLTLLRGILLLVVGGYLLFRPGTSMDLLTKVLGVYIAIEGLLAILAAVLGEIPSRGWTAVRGILMVLAGIFFFAHSTFVAGLTVTVILYLIAFVAILSGILDVLGAIQDRKQIEGEGWLILGGVLSIVFGAILLAAPLASAAILVRILGVYAIFCGISLIAMAFRVRGVSKALGSP